ncbi:MAG: hypothetical protein E6H09_21120 [Bacteroidetes bacterium]|nr:MAG: hypothetical protein E6H09_21120 [Bacteroidota bacterium]
MKMYQFLTGLLTCLLFAANTQAQSQPGIDSTGLPGDNFSLQGALAMFQKATSPEEFEKMLNSADNHVNNLDLNDDGDIDYIRVVDNTDKEAHAFVLQAVISENESQDIASIELEKTGDTTAILQIVGDEDIYGEEVIVEPGEVNDDDAAFLNNSLDNHIAHGPNVAVGYAAPRILVNVWLWPSVRFVYTPVYRPWISPWRWHHYPGWWRPWRPFAWHVWHPFHRPYYTHCAIVHTHTVAHAHRIYTPIRVSSVSVRTRHAAVVGSYRVTRAKASVTSSRGHGATRTRTTVTGPRGGSRTKTTIRRH